MTPDVNVVISHSEYTVLVVDDVVSNVLLLKVLLTNEKFKVITAGNGKEALSQAVNARRFDFVGCHDARDEWF